MKLFASKRTQRVTNFALAAMLVVSTLTASVPFLFSQKANAATNIVVTPGNTQGWTTDDTRANGHVAIISDSSEPNNSGALSMKTDAAPTAGLDKAQYMHYLSAPVALNSVTGALSFDTKQNSALFSAGTPSYQIPVYLNGTTGTNFATLVYEPYVDQGNAAVVNGVWQHWDINYTTSKFYSSKTFTGQGGSVVASQGSSTYTLAQIKQFFPNAVVLGYGLNVGSNNPGYDTEADNFTFNGTTYNFEAAPLAAPTNLTLLNGSQGYSTIPAGVISKNVTSSSTDLTWTAPAGGVNHYIVQTYVNNVPKGDPSWVGTPNSWVQVGNYGDGTYTYSVTAYDNGWVAGATATSAAYIWDHTAPIQGPVTYGAQTVTNGVVLSGAHTFTVNLSEANPYRTYVEVDVLNNGSWSKVAGNQSLNAAANAATLTISSPLAQYGKQYQLKISTDDSAGNHGGFAIPFTVDNVAPSVTISAPSNEQFTKNSDVVAFSAHDDAALTSVTYGIVGQGAPVTVAASGSNQSYSVPVGSFNLPDGFYTFRMIATDTAGNVSVTADRNFKVDNTAPSVSSLIAPSNGAILGTGTFLLDWSDATDAGSGVAYYEYQAATDPTVSNGVLTNPIYKTINNQGPLSESQVQASGSPDGTYYWQVRATDKVGNVGNWSDVGIVTVDTAAPTASFTFPSRGPSATSFQVKFSEAVNPIDASNPANYFLTNWPGAGGSGDLNGHALVAYDPSTHIATVSFTTPGWYVSGEQMWGVSGVHDLAGNVLLTTTAYSTPLTSPTAPGTPTAVTPTNNSTINWTWGAATDLPVPATDASGIKGYQYQFTNGSTIITDWTNTVTTSATTVAPVDGTYQLHVRALDNAGSLAGPESVGTVVVDQQPPVVNLTSPTNGATVDNSKQIIISGSTGDATSYTFEIGKTGQNPVVPTTTGTSFSPFTWDTSNVPSGNYIATLTAKDDAGNSASDSRLIIVDNTAPVISLASQITTTGNQPTIIGTVDDTTAALVAAFNGNNYPVTNNNGSFSFTAPTPLTAGDYAFSITATDVNGNESTQTAKVTVSPAPVTSANNTGTTSTITPIITSPAAAVLGASTTNNNGSADTGVKGATDDKTAAAINSDLNKGTVFGLAWYWWILILAALALIGWWIAAAVRRRNEEQA